MAKYQVKQWDASTFPSMYIAANNASGRAQRVYLAIVGVNLGLLVAGAVVDSFEPERVVLGQILNWISAICFLCAIGATVLLAYERWDKLWYTGRAVAESVKSLTWKFIMGADPFAVDLDEGVVVERFTKSLHELLEEHRQLAANFNATDNVGETVTGFMRSTRRGPVGVLRDLYLAQRVNEQQCWYANKADDNKRYQRTWFIILIGCQGCAAVAAVLLALNPTISWHAPAVFSTIASTIVAWGQVKRYQELSQAYGYAAHELALIAARAPYVGTREALARFVNDAETAISREHSAWIARRETI